MQAQNLAMVKRPSAQLNIKTKAGPQKLDSVPGSPEVICEHSVKESRLSLYKPVVAEKNCFSAFSFKPDASGGLTPS